jgi:hypothetical protein
MTNKTVPHSYNGDYFLFWRIPDDCPRGDVIKSDKPLDKSKWQAKRPQSINNRFIGK